MCSDESKVPFVICWFRKNLSQTYSDLILLKVAFIIIINVKSYEDNNIKIAKVHDNVFRGNCIVKTLKCFELCI